MEPLNRPAVIVADMLVDFVTGALANPPSQEIVAPLAFRKQSDSLMVR